MLVTMARTLSILLALAVVSSCDRSNEDFASQDPRHCLEPGAEETELQVECRCADTVDFCKPASTLPFGTVIGGGSTVTSLPDGQVYGGAVNSAGTALLAAVGWTGPAGQPEQGLVLSVDLANGQKAVVSGQYQDFEGNRTVVGAGPEFGLVRDVVRAIGGDMFALSEETAAGRVSVVGFVMESGDRSLRWSNDDVVGFGQCAAATVQPWHLLVDADNAFVMAADAPGDGSGIIKVSNDGASCEWITRSSGSEPDIGGGEVLTGGQYRDIVFNAGDLFAIYDAIPAIVRIAPDGSRELVSAADDAFGPIGAGPTGPGAIGKRSLAYDWQRKYFWTIGKAGAATNLVAISATDGTRVPITRCADGENPSDGTLACLSGPLSAVAATFDDVVWMHPDQRHLIIVQDGQSFVLHEPWTGNSNVFSY